MDTSEITAIVAAIGSHDDTGFEPVSRISSGLILDDPWHYLPVLRKKPGALRNGAPFKDWALPQAMARIQRKLGKFDNGDRQMVDILSAVLTDGLEAVEAACAETLAAGIANSDVVLNALMRRHESKAPATIITPDALALTELPVADCARYDTLRSCDHAAI